MTPYQLIALHAPTVRRLAYSVGRGYSDPDDLMQDGFVALLEAQFKAASEREQHAYVERRVRGAMVDSTRRNDMCSRHYRSYLTKIERCEAALANRLGRKPTDTEIAAEAEISLKQYFIARQLGHDTFASVLDEEHMHVDCVWLAQFERSATTDPLECALTDEAAGALCAAFEGLPPKYRNVLFAHYLDERTLGEIGAELGLSSSRICQMIKHALKLVREALD
jgi:RNA polymerase sigma factor FliA